MMLKQEAPGEDGFSLLEMLAVLALISLVSVVLTVNFGRGGRESSPREVVRQIADAARTASVRALIRGRNVVLHVDLTGRRVGIDDDPAIFRIPGKYSISMTAAERPVDSSHIGTIEFFPDGTSTGGEVVVDTGSSGKFVVRVFWLTGEISVRHAG